jgi:hypothetical protein
MELLIGASKSVEGESGNSTSRAPWWIIFEESPRCFHVDRALRRHNDYHRIYAQSESCTKEHLR